MFYCNNCFRDPLGPPWRAQSCESLHMVKQHLDSMRLSDDKLLEGLGPPGQNPQDWFRYMCDHPYAYRSAVSRHIVTTPHAVSQAEAPINIDIPCPDCGLLFHSLAALSGHRLLAHNKRMSVGYLLTRISVLPAL